MKEFFVISIFISTFCFTTYSQTDHSTCPAIKFVLPKHIVAPDELTIFAAEVEGLKNKNLTYDWTFSIGRILKGQGAAQVEFLISEEFAGYNFTAAVKVSGLPKELSRRVDPKAAVNRLQTAFLDLLAQCREHSAAVCVRQSI